ncbi:MAG TPA: hypothetical protein VHQ65_03305 [Thermoanaerobaculia bacterium]|nr:hypothetical protein [Thermoanaerobaculia bacterium]
MIKILSLALVLLAAWAWTAEEEMYIHPDTPMSLARPVYWTSEEEPAAKVLGILYFQQDPGGARTQLLLETAGGTRLALVHRIKARDGVMEILLREDESGWWVRLSEQLPAKGRLEELMHEWQNAHDRAVAAGGTVHWTLATSRGPLFEHDVPLHLEGADTQAFLNALDETDKMALLAAELPPALLESLPFLLGALRSGSPLWPSFDEILELLGNAAGAEAGPKWTAEETLPPPKGFPESVPEYAALLEGFEHVPFDPRN